MRYTKLFSLISVSLLVAYSGCGANKSTSQPDGATTQSAEKSVARDPIPDLPDYPGATRVSYTTGSDMGEGFSKTVKVESKTSDAHDKVIDFCAKSLKDNGWKMANLESSTESVAESKSRMTFTATKGTSVAKIEINQKGKDNIVITVERKDK